MDKDNNVAKINIKSCEPMAYRLISSKRKHKMTKRFKMKDKVCRCNKNKNGHHNLRKFYTYTPQVVWERVSIRVEKGVLIPLGDIE